MSVTDLVGGCGGGPRFLVFSSAPPLDAAVGELDDAGFFLFFIIKCRESSVLKSTAVPLLDVLVFCGLFPVDDADDGDSFVVGDVTPIANEKKTGERERETRIPMKIYQNGKNLGPKTSRSPNSRVVNNTYIVRRLALTLA